MMNILILNPGKEKAGRASCPPHVQNNIQEGNKVCPVIFITVFANHRAGNVHSRMMKTGWLCWGLCLFCLAVQPAAAQKNIGLRLGSDSVYIQRDSAAPLHRGFYLVHLHEDETTSDSAGRQYLQTHGGRMISLQHNGNRLVEFILDGFLYKTDPNRIFSTEGIRRTLYLLNRQRPARAIAACRKLAGILLQQLHRAKLVVALHNNTPGHFSIDSYNQNNSTHTYRNADMPADNFVLTTEPDIFRFLKRNGINAVLQRESTHDGSLSEYCYKRKIPYINIETEHGRLPEQLALLEKLEPVFRRYAP
jgi:hypothetical protein